jgi:hypothetical protein
MTKHRTITGFVAVALLAVAATAATMRSHSPWSDGNAVSSTTLSKGFTADPNAAPAANFDDRWSAMSDLPQTSR